MCLRITIAVLEPQTEYAKYSIAASPAAPSNATPAFINETNQAIESLSKKIKNQADEIKLLKKLVPNLSAALKSIKF